MLLGQELNRLILSLPAIKYSHFLEIRTWYMKPGFK